MNRELKYEIVDFNKSRPGHDLRYALSGNKMKESGWNPPYSFQESLQKTVDWTLAHSEWLTI
jgi:dTDP-glucose 4,6-dehydratase